MDKIREIGCRLKAEQNLAADDIAWLVVIAKAILRAFVWDEGQPMRTLAEAWGVSPTTFYTTLRLAVQALMLFRRGKQSVETLAGRVRQLRDRLVQVEQAYATAQAEVWRLTEALAEAQAIVATLQVQVGQLHAQWTVTQKRLIVRHAVLFCDGRCRRGANMGNDTWFSRVRAPVERVRREQLVLGHICAVRRHALPGFQRQMAPIRPGSDSTVLCAPPTGDPHHRLLRRTVDTSAKLGAGAGILVKLLVVVLGSFAVTLGLYQVFIRRTNTVRGLFGMKQEKRGAGVQTQARE